MKPRLCRHVPSFAGCNRWRRLRLWMPLAVALGGGVPLTTQAIDPLPPDIEAAPDAIRESYRQRVARESLEAKKKVGQMRFERRQENKRAINDFLREEASARQSYYQEKERTTKPLDPTGINNPSFYRMAIAILLIAFSVLAARRYLAKTADA